MSDEHLLNGYREASIGGPADHFRLGRACERAGEYRKAELQYLQAFQSDPTSSEVIGSLNRLKPKYLRIQPFEYRGISVPYSLRIKRSIISNLGTSRPAHQLAPKSLTRAEYAVLYIVGRDLLLGIGEAHRLPAEVQEAGTLIYQFAQAKDETSQRIWRAGWNKDAIMIEPSVRSIPGQGSRPTRNYIAARYFRNIQSFTKDLTNIIPNSQTTETRLWLPEYGWGIEEIDQNGLWTETIPDNQKQKAIAKLAEHLETSEEQAENELSYQFRQNAQGIYAVGSGSYQVSGPLDVYLSDNPRGRIQDFGSFPASRQASGASQ